MSVYDEPYSGYTSTQLGEEFYGNVDDNQFSGFWDNLLSEWINPDASWFAYQSDPSVDYTQGWADREEWWDEYGSMFNLDIESGLTSLDREKRIRDLGQSQASTQFGVSRSQELGAIGKTGFASSGAYQNTLDDLWSKYVGSTTALNLQYEDAQNEIYEDQGESIYNTLEDIAEQGGLDWEPEPGVAHCNCYGGGIVSGNQCLDIVSGAPMGPVCT